MKRFEIVLIALSGIAVTMKFLSIPGAGILTTLSLLILACCYFYLGFILFNDIKSGSVFNKGISTWRAIGSIGAGIGLSAVCVGILFKAQHWPGEKVVLLVGLITVFVAGILANIKYMKSKSNFYKSVLLRSLMIGGLGLLFLLFYK